MTNDIQIDVKPRGIYSAYVAKPFDQAKKLLESNGYRVISLEENARLRKQEGADSQSVSRNGNWVREGFVYHPEKGIFLTKKSPIMDCPEEATSCHRTGKEFYLNEEQVEQALSDSVQIPKGVKPIPTKRFSDNEITVYAFGDFAREYGEFLKDAGIKEMPIYLCDTQEEPFARQLWFRDLVSRSGLVGDCRDLDYNNRMRGVSANAEGVAQNFSGSNNGVYTQEQIIGALKRAKLQGIEKVLLENLKQ